jgi:hypothetical protein
MNVTYYLVGFDRQTERVAQMVALSDAAVEPAKDIAGLTPEIAAMWGDWPLTAEMVRRMQPLVEEALEAERLDWFLEPTAPLEGREALAAE